MNRQFDPDLAKASELEIRSTADGPAATVIQLVHSKLQRHGEGYEQYRNVLDGPGAWEAILAPFGEAVEKAAAEK